jgi:hypothetical protein
MAVIHPRLPEADVVILLVPAQGGYEIEVDNPQGLPDELIVDCLRQAADNISGVDDRARGCW